MKKVIPILLAVVLIAVISECALRPRTAKGNSDEFLIYLQNDSVEEISKIRYEYFIGETAAGGGTVRSEDGKTLPGHTLKLSFLQSDFMEDAELSEFSVAFYIRYEDGSEFFAGKKSFAAAFAESYHLALSGNKGNGYKISWLKSQP